MVRHPVGVASLQRDTFRCDVWQCACGGTILAAYNRAFFNKHLKEMVAPLLDSSGSPPYPEVGFETPGRNTSCGCDSAPSPAMLAALVWGMALRARRARPPPL